MSRNPLRSFRATALLRPAGPPGRHHRQDRQIAPARTDPAQVVTLVDGEKAAGVALKSAAFGDPEAYTLWAFANGLNGKVRIRILHAGDGTLWTDLDKATLGELGGAKVIEGARFGAGPGAESPKGR
jgi:hypothetical protein